MDIEFKDVTTWDAKEIEANKNILYVHEDNLLKVSKGRKYFPRDLDNTAPIHTKVGPGMKNAAFFSDSDYENNIKIIKNDILNIRKKSINRKIFFPDYEIGKSDFIYAPKTKIFLDELILKYFRHQNESKSRYYKIPGHDEIVNAKTIDLILDDTIVKPINNTFFRREYLSQKLSTYFDLIMKGKKIAFTSHVKYNHGDILKFSSPNEKSTIIVSIIESNDLKDINQEDWSLFEGLRLFNPFGDKDTSGIYQTHFHYIGSINNESGVIIFDEKLFQDTIIEEGKKFKEIGEKLIDGKPESTIMNEENTPDSYLSRIINRVKNLFWNKIA